MFLFYYYYCLTNHFESIYKPFLLIEHTSFFEYFGFLVLPVLLELPLLESFLELDSMCDLIILQLSLQLMVLYLFIISLKHLTCFTIGLSPCFLKGSPTAYTRSEWASSRVPMFLLTIDLHHPFVNILKHSSEHLLSTF